MKRTKGGMEGVEVRRHGGEWWEMAKVGKLSTTFISNTVSKLDEKRQQKRERS